MLNATQTLTMAIVVVLLWIIMVISGSCFDSGCCCTGVDVTVSASSLGHTVIFDRYSKSPEHHPFSVSKQHAFN